MRPYLWMLGGVLLSALLIYNAIFGQHGLRHIYELNTTYKGLVNEVLTLKRENENLRCKMDQFKHDEGFAEKVAREEWGLAKPGEVVYKISKRENRGSL